jgi:transposase-like protein
MIAVRAEAERNWLRLLMGHRESTESWADLLRSCKRGDMRAPVLAVGDRALGFWVALRDVFRAIREQRRWVHFAANVLNCLPSSAQPNARTELAQIYNAEDRHLALKAVQAFEASYKAKWRKAVSKITEHSDVLLEFYNYPAEPRVHLRTTNPIESTFATVRCVSG